MGSIIKKMQRVVQGLRGGRGHLYWEVIQERWYSERVSYGLRRDLAVPFAAPPARLPLAIRPWREADAAWMLDLAAPEITVAGRDERRTRLDLLAAGIATCYVAVTADDRPCFIQWLIGSEENAQVQGYFKGIFPWLAADEALLEGGFTLEAYRSQGIMSWGLAAVAERGKDLGARWAITFVTEDNLASLKGCRRAGFVPYLLRKETWRLGRRRLTFTPLPEGTPYPFDAAPLPVEQPLRITV